MFVPNFAFCPISRGALHATKRGVFFIYILIFLFTCTNGSENDHLIYGEWATIHDSEVNLVFNKNHTFECFDLDEQNIVICGTFEFISDFSIWLWDLDGRKGNRFDILNLQSNSIILYDSIYLNTIEMKRVAA